MDNNKQFTFIDFFAGIGGIRLGMEQAGYKCIGFCEFDKYAIASYTSMHCVTKEQRNHLMTLPMRQRQKEILKEEYRNGEWFANDISTVKGTDLPRADIWCFGAPCVSFSIAGDRKGLEGGSKLVKEIFRLLHEVKEEYRPKYLIYENVKGMLSSNRGFDFLAILFEMESCGYNVQYELFNSANFVPQNRERVYTVGCSRQYKSNPPEIFPLKTADGKNHIQVKQIAQWKSSVRDNPNQYRVYSPDGVSPTLTKMEGGGREPMVGIKVIGNTRLKKAYGEDKERVLSPDGIHPTLNSSDYKEPSKVGIPMEVDNSTHEPVYVELSNNCTAYAIWYDKWQSYIVVRKVMPKEAFRLQGFSDEMFNRAQFVNSDSQLYKQIGNSVTVPVITAIAKRIN